MTAATLGLDKVSTALLLLVGLAFFLSLACTLLFLKHKMDLLVFAVFS